MNRLDSGPSIPTPAAAHEPYYGVYVNSMTPDDAWHVGAIMHQDFIHEPHRLQRYLPNRYPDWVADPMRASQNYAHELQVTEPEKHVFIAVEDAKYAGIVKILKNETTKDAEVAYWFTKTRRFGTNLAKKAVAEAITTVFKRDPDIERMVAAHITCDNVRSINLIQDDIVGFKELHPQDGALTSPPDRTFVKPRSEWVAPTWYPDPPYTKSHFC